MTGTVVWFTGLPASGKSTLAGAVAARVPHAIVLDGDEVRGVIVPSPGYDDFGRESFYRTLAGMAALLARQGHVVLVAATAHRRAWRELARARAPRFVEVFVDTPVEECRRRDPKGLYARGGAQVPGVGVAYEPPSAAEIVVVPGGEERAVAAIAARVA